MDACTWGPTKKKDTQWEREKNKINRCRRPSEELLRGACRTSSRQNRLTRYYYYFYYMARGRREEPELDNNNIISYRTTHTHTHARAVYTNAIRSDLCVNFFIFFFPSILFFPSPILLLCTKCAISARARRRRGPYWIGYESTCIPNNVNNNNT